ncbi:MAG: ABC transporter permease [Phycisphaerae bacterium]|nr:ABC transporter permease [Phycisphaerae bacterium]
MSATRSHRAGSNHRVAGWVGAAILAFMLLVCLGSLPFTLSSAGADATGHTLPPRYRAGDLNAYLLPPSWASMRPDEHSRHTSIGAPAHLLGTDKLGNDLLIRCLTGGGVSIGIGLAAAAISVVIGTLYGALAGAAGGRVDALMMRIVDVLYGLPYVLIVVLLAVAGDALIDRYTARGGDLDGSTRTVIEIGILLVAIGGVSWLTMARVIRGQVLSLRAQPFMEAARALGVPWPRKFVKHLLPNLVGPIIVYATLTVPQAILQESFLSFLGIGVRPPMPSWGNLAADGLTELNPVRVRWWLIVFPCLLLGITLLSLNFVGEWMRERLDPRQADRAG